MKSVENIDCPNDGYDEQEKTQKTHMTLIVLERLAERGSTLVVHIALYGCHRHGLARSKAQALKP
jgi:hypothetical protein